MMSRDSHPDNQHSNSFDRDIADLLDDLTNEFEFAQPDSELDDLVSLFDQDLSGSFAKNHQTHSSGKKSSSSSSLEDEISNIFHQNCPSSKQTDPSPLADSEEDALDTIFAKHSSSRESKTASDHEELFSQLESSFSDISADKGLADLKQLLHDPSREAEIIQPKAIAKPTTNTVETDNILSRLYLPFEELESLLKQPVIDPHQQSLDEATAAALAAFIDAPVALSSPPQPALETTTSVDVDSDLDQEFKDLEALLEQADRTMGGSPTVNVAKGQRTSRARTKVFEQTMRVPVKQLDNLSNLIGELVVKRNRLEQDQERLRQFLDNLLNQVQNLSDVGGRMQDLYERTLLEGALLASRNQGRGSFPDLGSSQGTKNPGNSDLTNEGGLDALEMDRFTGFHLLSQEMIELIVRVRESASDIQFVVDETEQVARNLRQATTQLQEGMTKSRMVPFAQTAERLPRAVREISLKLKKKAKLQVEGRDVLVDKMILEHLFSPMTHLVNNAMTHGIETPEQRQKLGKPAEGRITLQAFLQGNQTVITVSDDGGGIDPEQVKAKAMEKELITREEADGLSESEIYDFLFHAGFSTRDKADDFAGRGVGLDVVRTSLSEVRGSVTIDSVRGKGTTFTIRLPLTLSICKALCCISDRARIAFPMDGVEDMKDYMPEDLIVDEDGRKAIKWDGQSLPLYPLGELLSYNRQLSRGTVYGGKNEEDTISVIVLRGTGNLLAVQVDQVIGEQEIVIKQIEGPVPKPPGIAGATVLGDGSIMPIGDVLELIEIAQGRMRTDGPGSLWQKAIPMESRFVDKTEPTVLIVDDSITVRELLSLSFSKAGYRVEQARDGQEAWEKLRSGLPCDVVFCDIEMPRMNGLELLAHIQKDQHLCDLPVALLTSRGADRHRQVAAKLGATAYFTKPCPDQTLLNAAQWMMEGEVLLPGSTKKPKKKAIPTVQELSSTEGFDSKPDQKIPNSVLIIDDSVMVREMLSMTFTKVGYEIEQARDGQEAWEKLRGGLSCKLILCDIEMPRMNGLELLSRLQEDEKLSQIPIAMITSRGAQKMQRIAAERGAKGYFVKPYIEEVLLDCAKRLIDGEVLLDINSLVES
ncbi:putative CheA signal transduction histidine kinase [Rippkaea orientalis PCC 8801]|uniref:histidine kinase n=1 Tax=Rippkaea orientalis (strain PCC 8801 / RF-1) TaxID=41431 RepID=B7K415_RIPO1|nr:hybrid sensor histidine kinase/response regulator [Rippkaea orientalis]ACK66555.1 putative CheA signal transduction histidine kinase [Rippkaea orientalis PCC 8801]